MTKKSSIRVGNCSGYLGDNLAAARQLVSHGRIDFLTGDYLAELTMAVLKGWQTSGKKPGYAGPFLEQLEQIAAECKARNIKIVVNAGGLEPSRMAEDASELLARLHVDMKVAHVEGDDLRDRVDELQAAGESLTHMDDNIDLADVVDDRTKVGTANVYQGCWGPTEALKKGAELVITGRGMDAAPVMAAAATHFGWGRHDYDRLAGALAAGHAIECGTQVTGGNFAGFDEVPNFANMGYGIAEIYEDGSADISMPQANNIGGMVTVDTVTAQLVYEVRGRKYPSPDVILDLTTGRLEQKADNIVHMSGFRGSAPTNQSKVCINIDSPAPKIEAPAATPKPAPLVVVAEVGLAGLDREAKAALFEAQLRLQLNQDKYASIESEIIGDPEDRYQFLRLTVRTNDREAKIAFLKAYRGLLISTYPGCFFPQTVHLAQNRVTTHWPAMVDNRHLIEKVWMDGELTEVLPTSQQDTYKANAGYRDEPVAVPVFEERPNEEHVEIELARLFYTRSGDKGGNANVGVWTQNEELYAYLCANLTPERLRALLPDMLGDFEIERYEFPNLKAVNFFVKGILGQGVSSNNNVDQQAKALGEVLGALKIPLPKRLLPKTKKAARVAPPPAPC